MTSVKRGMRTIGIRPMAVLAYCISFVAILLFCLINNDAETIVYRAIALAILVFCLIRGSREDTLVNPFTLFSITPFSLLIYNEKVSSFYLMNLDDLTWLVAIVGMASFLAALVLFKPSGNSAFRSNLSLAIPNKKLPLFALFLMVVGLVWALARLPLYSVVSLLIYPGFACAMASRKTSTIVVCVVLLAGYFVISPNKSTFLSVVLSILIFYELFSENKVSRAKIIIFVLICTVLMVVVVFPLKSYISGGYGDFFSFLSGNGFSAGDQYLYYAPRVNWEADSNLFLPYMYLVTPWCNLQYVIQEQGFSAHGLWLIKPLMGYLQLDSMYTGLQLIPYSTWNTFTFFAMPYADFGVPAVVCESFVVGVFVKYVYCVSTRAKAPLALGAYSLVAGAVLEMFFSNHFFGMSYPFTIVILVFLIGVAFRGKYGLVHSENEV